MIVGSNYFFSCYSDFKSKDIDELFIVETNDFKFIRQIVSNGRDVFYINKRSKQEHIQFALESACGMVLGKFLIPEFVSYFNFTIDDLKTLSPLLERLDEKHLYEKIVYESYLTNNDFILTNEQRDAAYAEYKRARFEEKKK